MIVNLHPAEAIAAAHAIEAYHTKMGKYYMERGVPGFMRQATRDHIETQESAHASLIAALRADGYVMRDDDLKPLDIDAIMTLPYMPPELNERT